MIGGATDLPPSTPSAPLAPSPIFFPDHLLDDVSPLLGGSSQAVLGAIVAADHPPDHPVVGDPAELEALQRADFHVDDVGARTVVWVVGRRPTVGRDA